MRRGLLALIFSIATVWGYAQQPMHIKMKDPVICYAGTENNPMVIPPPEKYLQWRNNPGARIKTAQIEVTYNGFSPQAEAAFQAAVDIWETLIDSPVPIKIEAHWTTLPSGALGGAIYTSAYANFSNAQKLNVFYPVAIAEKITGQNLNDDDPDIFAQFSNSANWHLNPATAPPPGFYDLVTVVLHEIGHGLGFASSFDVQGTNGLYGLFGTEVPVIFDVPIQNGTGQNLIASFQSPSAPLRTQLTSTNLFFDNHAILDAKLYAPAVFDDGSSISHLDDATFDGTANALMTHAVAPQERIHNPGISLNMLEDLGWSIVKINHQQFPGSESVSGPYTITATIQADAVGYAANSVKLNYTLDGTNFTTVTMTNTGTPNEFTANIPSTGVARDYGYYISVNDNSGREYVNPGKFVRENQPQLQNIYIFSTGPDTQVPIITHSPKGFLLEADTELVVDAKVTDNLGIESVEIEYYKNDNLIGTEPMVLTSPEEDSIYTVALDLAALNLLADDQVKYRIIATDVAVIGNPTGNIGFSPSASEFHVVNVVGLEPTQDSYQNDFNAASGDFFGNGFSITTPTGFSNGAIHTNHPYLEGNGLPGDQLNLIYQLRIPIRVKETEATIKFDEIVLVEPGDAGSVFGSENFFDYVVVEGSKDGGVTWTTVANGYDSRDYAPWLTRYNSAISGNNSTATGDPTLFRTRTLDLQQKFDTDDEVVIRFRLFSDPFAAGWGWCIDNLKIQIDDTPPLIQHNHIDYVKPGEAIPMLSVKVSDANELNDVVLTFRVNTTEITGTVTASNVTSGQTIPFELPIDPLEAGDVFEYNITTSDVFGNNAAFPPTGFMVAPALNFSAPVDTYTNNFNSATTDFVGNFFSVTQPTGFTNSAVHSTHNYSLGVGLDLTSDFTYTLTKPITIGTSNTYIRFDEIALVEGHTSGTIFGSPAFNDYVIVEGSKDGGETWARFADGYDAVSQSVWLVAFNSQSAGTSAMYRTRGIDMTGNGNFSSGDDVIIRFRLFSNATVNGWGWAIDNLYIQDAITSTEKELENAVNIYPNPARETIFVEAAGLSSPHFNIQLMNMQGQSLYQSTDEAVNGKLNHSISSTTLPPGIYLVKVTNEGNTVIRKVIKVE